MEKSKTDLVLKRVYPVLLAIALFTGFGNMPIYKRYYISDIPGLGWAGNFYINLQIHYITGALLLGLAVFFAVIFLKSRLPARRLTVTGALRAAVFILLLGSGISLAARNLSTIFFPFVTQMVFTFVHLGTAMLLLVVSIGCGITKSPLTRQR